MIPKLIFRERERLNWKEIWSGFVRFRLYRPPVYFYRIAAESGTDGLVFGHNAARQGVNVKDGEEFEQ
ncbi:hypothetical protein DAPPUDRAFT_250064 [Daphnia pulex]|uniref:Uncharacterized protein n=1 Tax=Daphnia pulex TaxID=6669 RepID=E9GXU6_DAPPU|nr:hypothetical protein DAPPUDRAFT_250064 [Daphnia pulex]|eukprot:EFX75723.1 hypothetical protein DAPPUDRAFT_250064 [Daphnia pulex]